MRFWFVTTAERNVAYVAKFCQYFGVPVIIPDAKRKKFLRTIHKKLMDYRESEDVNALAEACSMMTTQVDFAKAIGANPEFKDGVKNPSDLLRMAWAFLYHHLAIRDYVSAAFILWGPNTFTPEPHFAQLIWDGLFNNIKINVMGCASAGKSFCASAWSLLDWLLDPEWTRIEVASNSEEHVKKNLYADIVRLHSNASLNLPGQVDATGISINKKYGMGIFVLVIPGGPKAKGKAKGAKCKDRPHHPIFGDKSRLRFIFDEAQEITPNIFDDIPNIFASIGENFDDTQDTEHIKVFMAANPKDEFSRYGQNCKPIGGWEKHDDDLDVWTSEKGWHTIRLNAMKSENVMAGREIFPRLITAKGVQMIIQEAGSDQDPVVYSQVYAKFPPQGMMQTIIKPEHIRRSQREWIFSSSTSCKFSLDPAFTGDLPACAIARVGVAVGWTTYDGVRHDLPEPKMAIQVDATGVFLRGDTQDLVDEFLARAKQLNASPDSCGIDRTGVGQGVYDISRRQWVQKVGPLGPNEETAPICGIHYSELPSESKIAMEDTKTPREMYDTVATELWLAAGKLFEYDIIGLGRAVEPVAFEELSGRRGGMKVGKGRQLSVEAKKTYKGRTGRPSPDRADAITMVIHVARMTTPNLVPKAKDTKSEPTPTRNEWEDFNLTHGEAKFSGYEGHVTIQSMQD